jgi:thiamine biosynthesis lipoprotein
MASALRLQVHGAPDDAALAGWREVEDEFATTEAALSRFLPDSELTIVNREAGRGVPRPVGERLYRAVATADRARRTTGGRFDARVLAALERLGDAGTPLPAAGGVKRGSFRRPRGRLIALDRAYDLGGIGKGLALRWAWRRLATLRTVASGVLLEAGGDLVVGGRPETAQTWSIGVEDPTGGPSPVAVIVPGEGAVCTSSVARRAWWSPGGLPVHHLIDPASGLPGGGGLLSVTVASGDPAWAEVWSKALFLAGPRGIGDLARGRGLAAWWVDLEGGLAMTPAARQRTAWTADQG